MPDLSNTVRWLDFVPDLLGNRESTSPFYFLINGSMSKVQVEALEAATDRRTSVPDLAADASEQQKAEHVEQVRIELVDRYAAALEGFVKMGDEPLSFDGHEVKSLRDYLDAVTQHFGGLERFLEPYQALLNANSLGPSSSFSSGRLSGGFTSTGRSKRGAARAAR